MGEVVFQGVTTGRSGLRQASFRFLNMVTQVSNFSSASFLAISSLRSVLGVELLEVVGGREAAQPVAPEPRVVADAPHRGQHDGQRVVRLRRDEPDDGVRRPSRARWACR